MFLFCFTSSVQAVVCSALKQQQKDNCFGLKDQLHIVTVNECCYRFGQFNVAHLDVSSELLSWCVLIAGWNYTLVNYPGICQLSLKILNETKCQLYILLIFNSLAFLNECLCHSNIPREGF